MNKIPENTAEDLDDDDELRPEYDFSGGVRGKYAGRFTRAHVVAIDPDVARVFPDEESVNAALRALAAIVERHRPA